MFDYLLRAVDLVANEGWKLLPLYRFEPTRGEWHHRLANRNPPLSLEQIRYVDGELRYPGNHRHESEQVLRVYLDQGTGDDRRDGEAGIGGIGRGLRRFAPRSPKISKGCAGFRCRTKPLLECGKAGKIRRRCPRSRRDDETPNEHEPPSMSVHRYRVSEILAGKVAVGERVVVEGWVRTRRDSKAGLSFVHLSDGSTVPPLQVVATNALENYDEAIVKLSAGCAIRVDGELVASQGKNQAVEVQASAIEVVGWVDDPESYPMQPKRHSMEYLREVAHLRPRTNVIGAVARVRHALSQAIHRFFDQNGFYWIHTPIITAVIAKGQGRMFRSPCWI